MLEHFLSQASLQVGDVFQNDKTYRELKLIASDPKETHAFKVTNYTALNGLLRKLQQNIIHMEGEDSRDPQPMAAPSALSRRPCALAQLCPTFVGGTLSSPITSLSLRCSSLKWEQYPQSSSPPRISMN